MHVLCIIKKSNQDRKKINSIVLEKVKRAKKSFQLIIISEAWNIC